MPTAEEKLRAQLEAAAEAGRRAGAKAARTGRTQRCPYPLETLARHVWLRWYAWNRTRVRRQKLATIATGAAP